MTDDVPLADRIVLLEAEMVTLASEVRCLIERLDRTLTAVATIERTLTPVIEQLQSSPALRMIFGG